MRPEEDKFIERLYLDTFQLLWTYAMSKLNNPALAQEVVQDAFLEAIRNIEKLMSHENPRGWMKNTVKNKVKHAERSFNRYIIRFITTYSFLVYCRIINKQAVRAACVIFWFQNELVYVRGPNNLPL